MAFEAASLASRVVGELASGVQKAVGFDELLQSDSVESQPLSDSKLRTMIDKVAGAIRSRLEAAGIGVTPPVEVGFQRGESGADTKLSVSAAHPRAAEIESILAFEPEIVDQLQQIRVGSKLDRIVVSHHS